VPVFRFALERWSAGTYEIVVFHKGPLTADQQKALHLLNSAATDGQKPVANFRVHQPVDLSGAVSPKMQRLYQSVKAGDLPILVVRFPVVTGRTAPIWAGLLNRENVTRILKSPARKEIAHRLLQGHSAVWVLLESGDRARDDAATKSLEKQLQQLTRSLKLPTLTDSPDDQLANPALPLQLKFSILRVSRTDPAEAFLIQMLLHTEDDLADYNEPMVFPVYGRGRALDALVGKGITEENLTEAATFLIGPCTCTIKDKNPGIDLLMAADWERFLVPMIKERKLPPLVGPGSLLPKVEDKNEEPTPHLQPVNLESHPSQWQQSLDKFKKVPPLTLSDEALAKNAANGGHASTHPGAHAPHGATPGSQGAKRADAKNANPENDKDATPAIPRTSADATLLRNTLLSIGVGLVVVAGVYCFVRLRGVRH
jgi:hypothetical protein